MKSLISGTGISSFVTGQKLGYEAMNSINDAVNNTVEVVNLILRTYANINYEEGNLNKEYTLSEAIALISKNSNRRVKGIKIRFLEKYTNGRWAEYVYEGDSNEDESWLDENNWSKSMGENIIEGGVW